MFALNWNPSMCGLLLIYTIHVCYIVLWVFCDTRIHGHIAICIIGFSYSSLLSPCRLFRFGTLPDIVARERRIQIHIRACNQTNKHSYSNVFYIFRNNTKNWWIDRWLPLRARSILGINMSIILQEYWPRENNQRLRSRTTPSACLNMRCVCISNAIRGGALNNQTTAAQHEFGVLTDLPQSSAEHKCAGMARDVLLLLLASLPPSHHKFNDNNCFIASQSAIISVILLWF